MTTIYKDLLKDWNVLNKYVQELTEDELKILLDKEKKGLRRVSFMIRIYGRYNKLRTQRERENLFRGI